MKMRHQYKEKTLESKTQTEPYQNPPNHLTYEPQSTVNKQFILKDIYEGIDLFDQMIQEVREQLGIKKMYYRV